MSADQYSAILVRLDGLERQVRWRYFERLMIVALTGLVIASGPVAKSLRQGWQSLRLLGSEFSARAALDWSMVEARNLITLRPAVDPRTVLEDEQEAFGPPAVARTETGPVPASTSQHAGPIGQKPSSETVPNPVSFLALSPSPASSRAPSPVSALRSHDTRQASSSQGSSAPMSVSVPSFAPGDSHAGQRAAAQEGDKTFVPALQDDPKPAAVVPSLPETAAAGLDSSLSPTLPITHAAVQPGAGVEPLSEPGLVPARPGASASTEAPSVVTAPVPPVPLKALGYAQSMSGAQAILTDGATLYVVNEGEEFADRFRVTGIRPDGLDVDDRVTHSTFHLLFGH